MKTPLFLHPGWSIVALPAVWLITNVAPAQQPPSLDPVLVEGRPYGEALIEPYGQPRWSARGRFSPNTDVYVLPPNSFYLDVDYYGTFPRRGKPDHLFTQEFELGLPHRFQLAFELYEERQNGHTQVPFSLIEGRYALADWGKIPLNPTVLAEYRFGIGDQYPTQVGGNREIEKGNVGAEEQTRQMKKNRVPDAYELRLLLGQEIGKSIEFAANGFYDQELGGKREREFGFSTATSYAVRGECLKVGLETSYRNTSGHGARSKAKNIFEVGPSFTLKPSAHTRFDVAPLVGVTHDSPHLELFATFSIDFGTAPEVEVRAPASHGRY